MRGISFNIPNEYGRYLAEIFDGVNIEQFVWEQDGWNESYVIENGELGKKLFNDVFMNGETLRRLISEQDYYLIFVDIKAFPKNSNPSVRNVSTYQEFLKSDCQIVFLLADSSDVFIYLKNQSTAEKIYNRAITVGFENVAYITDENDTNPSLSC